MRSFRTVAAAALTAGAVFGATLTPAGAQDAPGIVDTVIAVSGAEGVDDNPRDFDILREALVATGLVDAVAAAQDVSVFAPNDAAFIRLAQDLGYSGDDEQGALGTIVEATGFASAEAPGLLDDVLLYHVAPGSQTIAEFRAAGTFPTLLEGADLRIRGNRVLDGDLDDQNAIIRRPRNLEVANGTIHTINRVLRPIDVDDSQLSIVEIVLAVSGAEGTDDNGADFDLLREALVATGLVDAVAAADDINVMAPTDAAFIQLAQDLGADVTDEAGALAAIIAATGFESAENPGLLDDVLLYHVAPGATRAPGLRGGENATLLDGATFRVRGNAVVDNDLDARNPRLRAPRNIIASDGFIHIIDRVMRPIDL